MMRVAIVLSAVVLSSLALVAGCEKKEVTHRAACPMPPAGTTAPPSAGAPAPGVRPYVAPDEMPSTQPSEAASPCPAGYCPRLDTGLVVPPDSPLFIRSTTQPEQRTEPVRRTEPATPPARQPAPRGTPPTTQRETPNYYN